MNHTNPDTRDAVFARFPRPLATVSDEVFNQSTPYIGHNSFCEDPVLPAVAERNQIDWAKDVLCEVGETVASVRVAQLAQDADRNPPTLKTHDRFGHRVDRVEFHPAWHELMSLAIRQEAHSLAWMSAQPKAHVARGMISYLWNQGESGICCPLGMTYSAIPALRLQPDVAELWEPFVLSTRYDGRSAPMHRKSGGTVGMTLTEKQAGSDLRAVQTTATPATHRKGPGQAYAISGHKWFFSAPQSDVFFTLAQTAAGPSCFLVPGWLPDGSRNGIRIQRLKDKCGNRSNASSEIEYRGALGWLIGDEGQGIRIALAMTHLTRLGFALGSAGLMRRAVSEAIHHASRRRAFQRRLADQPLMRSALADLALEAEAATLLAFRMAEAVDEQIAGDAGAELLVRLGTPVAKYWICKRVVGVVHEAMECHGGNGFIEDGPMARLYREAPLNGIWEGSGNVIALDVLRAVNRTPGCVEPFLAELRAVRGADAALDRLAEDLAAVLKPELLGEMSARRIVGQMATAVQASLLLRHSPTAVAEAFCATRLRVGHGGVYGALPDGVDHRAIIERAHVGGANAA